MGSYKIATRVFIGMGGLLLVLGLMIWSGRFGKQIGGLHVLLGMVLVLMLWVLSALAARAGVARGQVAWAASCGLIVLGFGLVQEELLTGASHWAIRVLHVVISMGAIWWARRLLSLMREQAVAVAGSEPAPPAQLEMAEVGRRA